MNDVLGKNEVIRGLDAVADEMDRMLIRSYAEVTQALATGMDAKGFKVVIGLPDSNPQVDPKNKVIYLPKPEGTSYKNLVLARGFVDHELNHCRFTKGMNEWPGATTLQRNLSNLMEDCRVDKIACSKWEGVRVNLQALFAAFDEKTKKAIGEKAKTAQTDYVEFCHAMYATAVESFFKMRDGNVFEDIFSRWQNKPYEAKDTQGVQKLAVTLSFEIQKLLSAPESEGDGDGKSESKSKSTSGEKKEGGEEKGDPDGKDGEDADGKDGEDADGKDGEDADGKDDGEGNDSDGGGGADSERDGEEKGQEGMSAEGDAEGTGDTEETEEASASGDGTSGSGENTNRDIDQGKKSDSTTSKETAKKVPTTLEDLEKFLADNKDATDIASTVKNEYSASHTSVERYTCYRDNDRILTPAPSKETPFLDRMMLETTGVYNKLYARMVRMYKQTRPLPTRRQTKGLINGSDVYRAVAYNEDSIFTTYRQQDAYNVAFTLLIDLSGSMSGRKEKMAYQTALLLGRTLSTLNIPFEILGFTTTDSASKPLPGIRRTIKLNHVVFKPFSERMSWKAQGRIETFMREERLMHNVDGEAVEWASERLLQRREQKRVLLVLSDGMPEDGRDATALNAHLVEMVKKYTKKNIALVGVGILTDAPKSFYTNSVCINDLKNLPTTVMDQIQKFIK